MICVDSRFKTPVVHTTVNNVEQHFMSIIGLSSKGLIGVVYSPLCSSVETFASQCHVIDKIMSSSNYTDMQFLLTIIFQVSHEKISIRMRKLFR